VALRAQVRKVEGLEYLLLSLSLEDKGCQTKHVVHPWGEYSQAVGEDTAFWYSAEGCQYGTLRKIIIRSLEEAGHVTSERLADAVLLLFIHMPKASDVLTDFEKLLSSFVPADVSQYLFIPASALLKIDEPGKTPRYDIAGFFAHGPFQYLAVDRELSDRIKYRFKRIGIESLSEGLNQFLGCIEIHKGASFRQSFWTSRKSVSRVISHGLSPC
jgi:hypothetical protein